AWEEDVRKFNSDRQHHTEERQRWDEEIATHESEKHHRDEVHKKWEEEVKVHETLRIQHEEYKKTWDDEHQRIERHRDEERQKFEEEVQEHQEKRQQYHIEEENHDEEQQLRQEARKLFEDERKQFEEDRQKFEDQRKVFEKEREKFESEQKEWEEKRHYITRQLDDWQDKIDLSEQREAEIKEIESKRIAEELRKEEIKREMELKENKLVEIYKIIHDRHQIYSLGRIFALWRCHTDSNCRIRMEIAKAVQFDRRSILQRALSCWKYDAHQLDVERQMTIVASIHVCDGIRRRAFLALRGHAALQRKERESVNVMQIVRNTRNLSRIFLLWRDSARIIIEERFIASRNERLAFVAEQIFDLRKRNYLSKWKTNVVNQLVRKVVVKKSLRKAFESWKQAFQESRKQHYYDIIATTHHQLFQKRAVFHALRIHCSTAIFLRKQVRLNELCEGFIVLHKRSREKRLLIKTFRWWRGREMDELERKRQEILSRKAEQHYRLRLLEMSFSELRINASGLLWREKP
ncbi:hypothetical protein ADUPG1_008294, partial [Aduncisulcus paluster]